MIIYTKHLELKLKLRAIPYELPERIYKTAKERYFDRQTELSVAVKEIKYKGKKREFALIYSENGEATRLITLHPLKPYQKLSRIKSGRWEKIKT